MKRLLTAALAGASLLSVPSVASAAPNTVQLETCWYGVCAGVYSRYHLVVTQPILAPDSGEIWNSQGFAGFFTFDPFDESLSLVTINFPIGLYDGLYVDGCLSGSTGQVYYGGYGDFFSAGCP